MSEEAKLYRLRRRYHDGRMLHQAGDKVYFVPGNAPSTAILVESEQAAEAAEAAEVVKEKKAAAKAPAK